MNLLVRALWRLIPENERAVLLSQAPHFRQRHIERVLKGRAKYQPCFDEHRALFIHVPKSAGRSIVRGLFGVRSVEHAPADWYQLLDPAKFDDYFKFTFVRNPWDRAVSAYTYLLQGGSAASAEDRQWSEFVSSFDSFDDFACQWITPGNVLRYALFTPQVEFLKDRFGRIDMDFIGRFESLADDFASVAERLGVEASLPHINSSREQEYQSFYTDASRKAVAEAYAEDIASFNYRFGE